MIQSIHDKTITVHEAPQWGMSNVYIFPEKNRHVRGVLWVIPPCDVLTFSYAGGPGFCAQNYAYDQIKIKITEGHIAQDDWIIVIAPTHYDSLAHMSAMALREVFPAQKFNYAEHINLCGCCTDQSGREFINVVFAMGEGAMGIEFDDPAMTNLMLIDPILQDPNIPSSILATTSLVYNPKNYDDAYPAQATALLGISAIKNKVAVPIIVPSKGKSNHIGLFAVALLAFAFDALTQFLATNTPPREDFSEAADAEELNSEVPIIDDPSTKVTPPLPSSGCAEPADFKGPQVIITSDRLVFNSKQDSVLISSNTHIGLSAKENVGIDADGHFTVDSPEINLGLNATEPILLGNVTADYLKSLVAAIQALTYTNMGGATGPAVNAATLNIYKNVDSLKSPQNKTL
jgi:hypothetical protein